MPPPTFGGFQPPHPLRMAQTHQWTWSLPAGFWGVLGWLCKPKMGAFFFFSKAILDHLGCLQMCFKPFLRPICAILTPSSLCSPFFIRSCWFLLGLGCFGHTCTLCCLKPNIFWSGSDGGGCFMLFRPCVYPNYVWKDQNCIDMCHRVNARGKWPRNDQV